MALFDSFCDFLTERCKQPLPGWQAHKMMGPRLPGTPEPVERHFQPSASPRHSSVLVVLTPEFNDISFVLTKRPDRLRHHGGQLSLPGGRIESGETAFEAAIREAHEEIGLDPRVILPLGDLSPIYIIPSNNHVQVCLAAAHNLGMLAANPEEVDEILLASVPVLANAATESSTERRGASMVEAPYWMLGSHKLWGATAMICAELVWLFREFQDFEHAKGIIKP